MNRNHKQKEASRFRTAIETVKDVDEFKPEKPYQCEPINNYPHDCFDDTQLCEMSMILDTYSHRDYTAWLLP